MDVDAVDYDDDDNCWMKSSLFISAANVRGQTRDKRLLITRVQLRPPEDIYSK